MIEFIQEHRPLYDAGARRDLIDISIWVGIDYFFPFPYPGNEFRFFSTGSPIPKRIN